MNTDRMHGAWEEFKGRVKMAYADLTDDDIARAQGSREKLFGIIEQRFGEAKDKAEARIARAHLPKSST